MGFWDFFNRKTSAVSTAEEMNAQQPATKQDDAAAEAGKQEGKASGSMAYDTRMPIDLIYAYLREDYEAKGYEDALCNPDTAYKEINKSLIRSNLEILFKQVILRYEDDLRDIGFHIQSRTEAGLLDLVEQLKARKETYREHVELLKNMEADLRNNAPYMVGMMLSYDRGFLRGLAAISMGTLNK